MQASNIVTWFTHPSQDFDSFYYYDTDTRELVRVRLELNRKDNDGPVAMYRANRYVGFANGLPESLSKDNCSVVNGIITLKNSGTKLSKVPTSGLNVYDFSASNNSTPDRTPHKGNAVVASGKLPPGIDQAVLLKLVHKCLDAKSDIPLGKADINPQKLSDAILKAVA